MARIEWNTAGTRLYEAGVDRGVLYVAGGPGVPWVGLTSIEEAPVGGEPRGYYLDGVKYLNLASSEEFQASISAYTYPNEFGECDGTTTARPGLFVSQQRRKSFGLSYRTKIGNDVAELQHGYKIHLIYDALATPTQKSYSTQSETGDVSNFTWNLTTRPPATPGYKRSSHIVIDSRTTNPLTLVSIEDILYGSSEGISRLPTFEELVELYDSVSELVVSDNSDGTFIITGPDEAIEVTGTDTVQITWPSVVEVDTDTYSISS